MGNNYEKQCVMKINEDIMEKVNELSILTNSYRV